MKRIALCLFALALLCAPASATELLNLSPITAAIGATETGTFQLRGGAGQVVLPTNLTLQANFTYGSGGTSVDAYVQTSIDGGTTWIDVAEFHFTTASERYAYNIQSATSVTSEYTATDGTLSANTSKDGIFGNQWRVKYTSSGTYAGGTSLRIDGYANGLTAFTLGD
jgi:hypothetical protein